LIFIVQTSPARSSRAWRRHFHTAFSIALAWATLTLAGCGTTATQNSDAKQASDALNAGLQAQTKGKTQEAINDYNTVLAHDPKNKYAYYNLGLIDQTAGRNTSAEKNYRAALGIDPQFEPALFNLAILRTGPSPSEAENLYRQVITANPKNDAAHLNLGFLLSSLARQAEATAEFNQAVSLDPQLISRIPPSATVTPKASPKP
jgi:tetratricopeptide (TPR) repeat protein